MAGPDEETLCWKGTHGFNITERDASVTGPTSPVVKGKKKVEMVTEKCEGKPFFR
jgi:hypothetical protein